MTQGPDQRDELLGAFGIILGVRFEVVESHRRAENDVGWEKYLISVLFRPFRLLWHLDYQFNARGGSPLLDVCLELLEVGPAPPVSRDLTTFENKFGWNS